ncbi:MAG TPA: hypothetical protein VG389_07565 [Myxococcota bacterium]|jgi:hypothetical protein|nr:hypothetical protein [Myxococcota bacterium]
MAPRRFPARVLPLVWLAAALGAGTGAATLAGGPDEAEAAELVDTWVDVSPPTRAGDLRVVYPDPFRKGVVWLGGVGGVLYSDDGGDTWVESLRLAARSRTLGGGARAAAAASSDAEDAAAAAGSGDSDTDESDTDTSDDDTGDDTGATGGDEESAREELVADITEAAIDELSEEFGIPREDVEVVIPEELETLVEERFGDLLVAGEAEGGGGADTDAPAELRLDAIETIASSAAAPAVIYAGGTAGVYVSHDDGTTWDVRAVPGGRTVTELAVDPDDSDHVLASTLRGLWESTDGGVTWTGTGPAELEGKAVAGVRWDGAHPDRAAAWTRTILGLTDDGGESWTTRDLAAATAAGRIRAFTFIGAPAGRLAVAGDEESFFSDDAGETWSELPDLDETPLAITSRAGSDLVFAAGTSRVYRVDGGGVAAAWTELADGWATARPRDLVADPHHEGQVWAVSSAGLFHWMRVSLEALAEKELRMLAARFDGDPTLDATLAAAVGHAGLDPAHLVDMTERMHWAALLPEVRLYWSYRLGHSESPDGAPLTGLGIDTLDAHYFVGTLSWDLGAVTASPHETVLPSLAARWADAREELVDRVLAAYSQRRAVAIALVRTPPSSPKARLAGELKFMELTAELDGLTGGWFSRHVKPSRVLALEKKGEKK